MAFTVMLVDDDEALTPFLERAIRKIHSDISLLCVSNGEEAVDYLTKGENRVPGFGLPSLILLDIKMPRMNGFDVLEWKRSQPQLNSLPVVMWSSSSLDEDKEKARALGAVDYVIKPMDLGDFVGVVKGLEKELLHLAT